MSHHKIKQALKSIRNYCHHGKLSIKSKVISDLTLYAQFHNLSQSSAITTFIFFY